MDIWFTPWRYKYVTSGESKEECFICAIKNEKPSPANLIVAKKRFHLVVLNKYPYTTAHLLIAPSTHVATPLESERKILEDEWWIVIRSVEVVKKLYNPWGFNIGMNLSRVAGAGLPQHYHFHVVPRWQGDHNFMSVIGGVRMIPEELEVTWNKLRREFVELGFE